MEQLEYFRLFHPLTDAAYALLADQLKTKRFGKGDFIVQTGQVQRNLYFVKTGVQMSYFDSGDKVHVVAFTYPPNPCAIPESYAFQKPAPYFLKCLTDSTLDYIEFERMEELLSRSHDLERLFRKMTEAILAGLINRHISLHAETMEERFVSFANRSPHLFQLVPHKLIASYLGIDPTNFSKLYNRVRF